jgi:hypothetical protein
VVSWLLEAWKAYAHRAATYQTRLLLTLAYALILGPAGLMARAFGTHLLDVQAGSASSWLERPDQEKTLDALRRQF